MRSTIWKNTLLVTLGSASGLVLGKLIGTLVFGLAYLSSETLLPLLTREGPPEDLVLVARLNDIISTMGLLSQVAVMILVPAIWLYIYHRRTEKFKIVMFGAMGTLIGAVAAVVLGGRLETLLNLILIGVLGTPEGWGGVALLLIAGYTVVVGIAIALVWYASKIGLKLGDRLQRRKSDTTV